MQRINASFFKGRPTTKITKELLGKKLVYNSPTGVISGWIVEAESYLGENDSAAHAYQGRRSSFNEPLYHEAGVIYIYQRRQHFLFDVVTQDKEEPEGILVRAVEPAEGIELMKMNRPIKNEFELTNGPAKLMQAYGIQDRSRNFELISKCSDLTIDLEDARIPLNIISTPRIGVNLNGSSGSREWRFYVAGNPYVGKIKKGEIDFQNWGWQK
ncbi:DNA-3-methyladenine glycosylase [Xylocopilactobacillus apis]|uniref:Putative 3-methyladenine DNA glycosylase n=1 Tax=Xylocopilactobacillus apis TaxID=2932183 RepID=A0AAU9D140_9LACO|nr:DNA-3-methyladenine glycosylase [Xylocopilactobacillus apis]BDR57414.1 putative 3-methyladenine DNA glycosylase [Xylocopilactobacillus apis]